MIEDTEENRDRYYKETGEWPINLEINEIKKP